MLETDANLYPTDSDNDVPSRLAHYASIVEQMHLDDLPLLEKDLTFYEKVSLLFLLSGHTQGTSQLMLQRLTVAYRAQHFPTTYLLDWARTTADWARTLVEALAIVQANRVLHRLGIDQRTIADLDLLPRQPDVQLRVHPILKWLHHLCEQLVPHETLLLINGVCAKFPQDAHRLHNISEPSERYLELWLLVWLSERLIEVGDWEPAASSRNRKIHCRLDAVLAGMKTSGNARLVSLQHRLEAAQIRFNCTLQNVITFEPKSDDKVKSLDGQRCGGSERQLGDGDASAVALQPALCTPQVSPVKLSRADEEQDDRYVMRSHRMGVALIVNQDTFHRTKDSSITKNPLAFRSGSQCDKQTLARTLTQLGFACATQDNLTARQTEDAIGQATARCTDLDSIVVCILSHGFEGHVYASDTVAMKIDRIEQLLCAASLLRKPKLLIVQACQGDETQELMGALETDGPTVERKPTAEKKFALLDVHGDNHPLRGDMCVAMSTIPGYVSYRNTVHGSWFVQTLCDVMDKSHQRMHFVDMLTKVCFEISKKRGDQQESMVPRFASSLRKQLYFTEISP